MDITSCGRLLMSVIWKYAIFVQLYILTDYMCRNNRRLYRRAADSTSSLSRYLIPQSRGHKSPATAVSVINFQTARGLHPEGGPRAFARSRFAGGWKGGEGYFVNHSTGFIIEDVRVNGGAAAASTATPEKKGKASGGGEHDDGKRAGERASWPGMTRS